MLCKSLFEVDLLKNNIIMRFCQIIDGDSYIRIFNTSEVLLDFFSIVFKVGKCAHASIGEERPFALTCIARKKLAKKITPCRVRFWGGNTCIFFVPRIQPKKSLLGELPYMM